MSEATDLSSTHAYTRQAVQRYLQAVAVKRTELEAAIAEARARSARVAQIETLLASLEQRIGRWILADRAQSGLQGAGNSGPRPLESETTRVLGAPFEARPLHAVPTAGGAAGQPRATATVVEPPAAYWDGTSVAQAGGPERELGHG